MAGRDSSSPDSRCKRKRACLDGEVEVTFSGLVGTFLEAWEAMLCLSLPVKRLKSFCRSRSSQRRNDTVAGLGSL